MQSSVMAVVVYAALLLNLLGMFASAGVVIPVVVACSVGLLSFGFALVVGMTFLRIRSTQFELLEARLNYV